MAAQAGKVILLQKFGVADLHRIPELGRQRGQERVEAVQELARAGEAAVAESAEFENQHRGPLPVWAERPQEPFFQHAVVEERLVLLAAPRAVTRVLRKNAAGDLLRRLERKVKCAGVGWNRRRQNSSVGTGKKAKSPQTAGNVSVYRAGIRPRNRLRENRPRSR